MCSNCNIIAEEFYSKFECIDKDNDIWQDIITRKKIQIIMEDSGYVIGRFL